MSRLRAWSNKVAAYLKDPWTVSRGLTLVFLAIGLTLLLSALISPLWILGIAFRYAPEIIVDLVDLSGLSSQQLLIAYGAALTLAAVALFVTSEVTARRKEGHPAHLREQMLLGFLATGAFVAGFVGARAIVMLSGIATSGGASSGSAAGIPVRELWLGGYHIHHFFYGFLLLVAAGGISLFFPSVSRRWTAVLYGLGIGIFVDEWGLLVTMGDYHARSSWFAGITFLSLFVLALIVTFGQVREELGDRDDGGDVPRQPPPGEASG